MDKILGIISSSLLIATCKAYTPIQLTQCC